MEPSLTQIDQINLRVDKRFPSHEYLLNQEKYLYYKDEFFVYYGLVPVVANPSLGHRTAEFSSGAFVEKHNNVGNPAVPSNEEISPGVSWHFTKAARYPFNPSVIAQLLGHGNGLILKVRVSGPELACDAVDLVSAAEYTPPRIVKCAIFVVDLVDGRAPTRRVIFTEDVAKIADHQGRYAVGHEFSRIVGDYNYNCVSVSSALRLVCSILNIKVG